VGDHRRAAGGRFLSGRYPDWSQPVPTDPRLRIRPERNPG